MFASLSPHRPARPRARLQLEVLEDRLVPSAPEYVSTNPNDWPMYNHDPAGTRYNSAETQISPESVGRLAVQWSFPTEGPVAGTPAVVGDTIYAVDGKGVAYAIRRDGTELWRNHLDVPSIVSARVSASPLVTNRTVIFGDLAGYVHGLDRDTGIERWRVRPNDHPAAAIFGSPVMVGNNIAIGIASLEELLGADPSYVPSFRGSVALLDPRDGRILWQTFTIRAADHAAGASGAAVWSTPTYDPESQTLFINTGNNYSQPTTDTSDSFMALDARDGHIRWITQTTDDDDWTLRNLPEDLENHPDFGYGDSPQLYTVGGRKVIGAGEKSGLYYLLDATTGQILQGLPVVPGGMLGGLMPDSAVARGVVFANGVDWPAPFDGGAPRGGSLTAIAGDGSRELWSVDTLAPNLSGVAVANDVVFFQSLDGILYALDARTGAELTWVPTHGQTSGPAISRGQVVLGIGDVMGPYFNPFQELRPGAILALGLAPELPHARPFAGSMSGQFLVAPTAEPAVLEANGTASGHATHLGHFTKVTHDLINMQTGLIDGSFTITTARGDTLTGTYVGRIIPGPTPLDLTLVFKETITGGTGRFAGAQGSFTATSQVVLVPVGENTFEGRYEETFGGKIAYHKAGRPSDEAGGNWRDLLAEEEGREGFGRDRKLPRRAIGFAGLLNGP